MPSRKPLEWVAGAHNDYRKLPEDAQRQFGFELGYVQVGGTPADAKPLHGFGGADVQQLSASDEGGTYRAVYTVRFERAVYVLHAFAKKSKSGSKTPKEDMQLIRKRLSQAAEMYRVKYGPV